MKFDDPRQQIEYLEGRIKGLEGALEDLFKLLSNSDSVIRIPDKFRSSSGQARNNIENSATTSLFDLEAALSKADRGNSIDQGDVKSALTENWHRVTIKTTKNYFT